MLFDTHTHLNADQFNDDIKDVIEHALATGVKNMLVVGFDRKTIKRALTLVEQYDFIYAAIGWHPVDALQMTDEDLSWIRELSSHPKVVALGEMGLDYHWDRSPRDIQNEVFRKQIRLAKSVNLPIIIHNREATEDVISILKEENASEVGGIMHCYSSDLDNAQTCIDMNFYISFGGNVTFKNAHKLKEVAKEIPLRHMLIETDCPYLTPHPYRGKRNEPAYVKLVAEEIARLKGIDFETVAQKTFDNARRLFRITS